MSINIFYTTCSSIKESRKLAKRLIMERDIVCVNVIKNVESFYKESKNLKKTVESVLIIKTFFNKRKIEDLLKETHPYEIPFIVQFKSNQVNNEYLKWSKKNL